jgi:NAD(P)-dependent dehydrogenase (short-subunit alcohol dehydrogenase family)
VYGGAKAALELASEVLAGEVRPFGIKVTVVIPGPFRTGFIDHSIDFAPRLPEYAPTVGKFGTILERIKGKQPGDTAKAAQAILDLTELEKPPLRLLLGAYAHDRFGKKLAQLGAELEASKPLGLATDFAAGG